ncbi:MAG: hypothetical protein M1820_008970 [Bogoriella megaspora]|nr:MAG: hypothetical protein M1820_008970 [Bogoriella megaspora]
MAVNAAIGAAADPRLSIEADVVGSYPNRVLKTLHDPNVSFEEYLYYAKISRADEERLYGPGSEYAQNKTGILSRFLPGTQSALGRFPGLNKEKKEDVIVAEGENGTQLQHFDKETLESPEARRKSLTTAANVGAGPKGGQIDTSMISDAEWLAASRAARTATWGAVFYLITTDILGPFSVPWAMTQLGWGPGVSLYTIFGALAGYSGWQIWKMFLGLDSDRYPLKNYGDLAFRVYGQWARYFVNFLQSLQFFLNVGLLILSNGQSISQMSKENLCFAICLLVFTIAGFIVGQIRTLAKFGWLANLAVWMNIFIIIATMGIVAHSDPNYVASAASYPNLFNTLPSGDPDVDHPPPISTSAGSAPGLEFTDNVNGLMQAVFSYGGATLFNELMAEMRRPWDFWKGLICADLLIFCCYLFFGCFVYGIQGQYAFNPAYQGIDPYGWQTVGNVFGVITGLIAACLYGNIGIKVLYANVGRDVFRFPPLESKKGKLIFIPFVPIYWALAFIVTLSIPQFSNFSSLVGAACILQFTYTFPPILIIGFKAQRDAVLPEEEFDPNTGVVNRVDYGFKRWMRGIMKDPFVNAWDFIYFLGALVTAILGMYSAIKSMAVNYSENPNLVGWGCQSPTG